VNAIAAILDHAGFAIVRLSGDDEGLRAALTYLRAKADRIEASSPNQAHDLRRAADEIEASAT
jgi:hypothetical protein